MCLTGSVWSCPYRFVEQWTCQHRTVVGYIYRPQLHFGTDGDVRRHQSESMQVGGRVSICCTTRTTRDSLHHALGYIRIFLNTAQRDTYQENVHHKR